MRVLLSFFLLLCGCRLAAQFSNAYDFKFKTYTTQDGLVHNYTKKCVEDSKGFLWIITQHGLSRFDGLIFKNFENIYNNSTSLPANDLYDIAIDKNDRIWLSYNTGLCYYDQSDHVFHLVKQNNELLQSTSLVYNQANNCMYSITYNNYTKINCKNLSINKYNLKHSLPPHFTSVGFSIIDSKQRLWIPCPRYGYFTIDLKTNEQYYYNKNVWPTQFYEDTKKQIWMTTWSNGLYTISLEGLEHIHTAYLNSFTNNKLTVFTQIAEGITQSSVLTGDSILWIANQTSGIQLFNKNSKKFVRSFNYDPTIKYGITTDFNSDIYSDKNGIVWVCTWHGITKINKQEQQFNSQELPYLNANFYNRLSGIADDPHNKNIVWLSAEGSGIFKMDKITGKVLAKYYYNLENNAQKPDKDINYLWRWPRCLFTDSKQNIWLPGYGGLIEISNNNIIKIPINSKDDLIGLETIIEMGKDSLWIAARRGLVYFDVLHNTYKIFRVSASGENTSTNKFLDIKKINDHELVIAGDGGAYFFNIISKKFTALEWQIAGWNSSAQHTCTSLEKIKNYLFIGTDDGLISYDLNTGKAIGIGHEEGISHIIQCSLKKDSGDNLWIYSAGGLFKYSSTLHTFQKFTTGDGIYDLSNDGIGFFEYNNLFYLGYRMAYTSFDPLQVNINPIKSIPVITDVLINNKSINSKIDSFALNPFQLSYQQNNITINYTSPDFTNSDKITFAYQLQAYNNNWILAGAKRTATYTNLPNGKYIFSVKACNSSGLWNNQSASFSFEIATPFWRTWWFYFAAIVLVCLLIYKLYHYRLNRVLTLYKIRDDISKNLHDEIGATLSSINIYSELAKNKSQANDDVKKLLERIYDASAQVMEGMSDIVWYINPKNDSAENTIIKMREYAAPVLEAKQTNLIFSVDEQVKNIKLNMLQRQNFYLLFKEAINNIAKYACAKHAEVIIKVVGGNVHLQIKDDGKGFDLNNHKQGNGLNNMNQRTKFLKGNCIIKSEVDKGTLIEINFPVSL